MEGDARTMRISRRRMLLGALAAAVLPVPAIGQAAPGPTRRVPSTGEAVPAVGLGTWITFNVGRDPRLLEQCAAVMAAFFDEGGGMIDSSPMYGSSQNTVGHGLEKLGFPETLFSAEKVWTSSPDEGPEQIAESRAEWRVDGFDVMQVHNLLAWQEHLERLFAMKAEGRIRYVGITTSHGRRHNLLERIMRERPIDFVQLSYNVADTDPEDRILPLAREKGIGVIVNRPFRRGALIRRLQGEPLPAVARDLGADAWPEVILKYILSHPAVTVTIPATTRVDHVRQNKAAARGVLPDERQRRAIVRHFRDL